MISDLTGIEDFSNLEGFNLGNIPLDSIDLSSNMELRSLHIYNYPNSFTNYINLNPSVNLDSLFLVGVNISDQNFHNAFIPTMESTGHVEIYNCSFVNLDLSLAFQTLGVNGVSYISISNCHYLTSLNLGYKDSYFYLSSINNVNLFCIETNNLNYISTNYYVDSWTSFSSNYATAFGCIDSLATNYDPIATIDDSSCTYQMTYVPDDEFEFYLEFNPNYEINNTQFLTSLGNGVMDDSVYTHLVEQVEIMDMNGYSSTTESIIGIEDFKNLEYIELYAGPIKSIDFSQNRNLRFVHMGSDSLTSLLMNDSVYVLNLNSSNLDSLSLIQCSNLSTLSIYGNNSLSYLNLKNGNNYNLGISINSCPNLYCVDVDDPVYSTANWTNIDSWTNFSSN